MRALFLFLFVSMAAVDAFFIKDKRKSQSNPLQPHGVPARKTHKSILKYVVQLYTEIMKHEKKINLQCIFPKIMMKKRSIKLIFKNNSFKGAEKGSKWMEDELRLFMMKTAKRHVTMSTKLYLVKIFDLYSQRKINVFKFSTKEFGWKTLNISDWRRNHPQKDSRGRVGIRITISLGKRELNISETAFRKMEKKYPPYFIEFYKEVNDAVRQEEKSDKLQAWQRKRNMPDELNRADDDYYIPFHRYTLSRSLD
ncbi:uncharacterized protein LOC124453701 [Xenia sp. Carnegie-2017]|uniref:uncharacterized protein LOC124453701 n=1 Tax=Xenia sp. Carnegie-2017 TaxID=2897299 RepID=UPI001F041213|nr:uncharacterized protein LOC124453701 [Xenia sp. Carnegie-2017]